MIASLRKETLQRTCALCRTGLAGERCAPCPERAPLWPENEAAYQMVRESLKMERWTDRKQKKTHMRYWLDWPRLQVALTFRAGLDADEEFEKLNAVDLALKRITTPLTEENYGGQADG